MANEDLYTLLLHMPFITDKPSKSDLFQFRISMKKCSEIKLAIGLNLKYRKIFGEKLWFPLTINFLVNMKRWTEELKSLFSYAHLHVWFGAYASISVEKNDLKKTQIACHNMSSENSMNIEKPLIERPFKAQIS